MDTCPYREAALRALAGSQKQWRIVSTSPSLAGVRAAAMAGLALTPLPLKTIRPGLAVIGTKHKMPRLPEIEYVLQARETDTRPAVSALADLIQEMATTGLSTDAAARAGRFHSTNFGKNTQEFQVTSKMYAVPNE